MNAPIASPVLVARELVRLFVPAANGPEAELRARICAAREKARSKIGWANSIEGARLYDAGSSVADVWWRRPDVSVTDLKEVLRALAYVSIAADVVERLERGTDE